MPKFTGCLAVIVLFVWVVACGSGQPLRVTAIQLGRSLNVDNTVARHTSTFARGDTVYVSVVTSGAGSGTIGVRWKYAGGVVGEAEKQVAYKDAAATEFHLQSGTGFPPGDYTAEILLNGQSVGTREFRVEAKR